MSRDAAIILGTASNFWLTRVPGLGRHRFLTKNSPQAKSLGPGNLGAGYTIVIAALDANRGAAHQAVNERLGHCRLCARQGKIAPAVPTGPWPGRLSAMTMKDSIRRADAIAAWPSVSASLESSTSHRARLVCQSLASLSSTRAATFAGWSFGELAHE